MTGGTLTNLRLPCETSPAALSPGVERLSSFAATLGCPIWILSILIVLTGNVCPSSPEQAAPPLSPTQSQDLTCGKISSFLTWTTLRGSFKVNTNCIGQLIKKSPEWVGLRTSSLLSRRRRQHPLRSSSPRMWSSGRFFFTGVALLLLKWSPILQPSHLRPTILLPLTTTASTTTLMRRRKEMTSRDGRGFLAESLPCQHQVSLHVSPPMSPSPLFPLSGKLRYLFCKTTQLNLKIMPTGCG